MLVALAALIVSSVTGQPPSRVGGLALDAPATIGNCPNTRVHVTGRINATGPLDVTYQWIRSDHSQAPVKTLHFDKKGPLTINYDWSHRGSASGWVAFKVLAPNPLESKHVSFSVCK
jgi:hypothetical protein